MYSSTQTATSDQQQSATANNPNSPPAQVQCTLCGWNFDNDNKGYNRRFCFDLFTNFREMFILEIHKITVILVLQT